MQREKDRQLEYDDTSNNVHPLFPGIDLTPFGRAADSDDPSDNGWSGIPEPTVVTPRSSAHPSRRIRWRALGAAWVAAALLLGGGISIGRTLLARPTFHNQKSKVTVRTDNRSLAALEPRVPTILRTGTSRFHQRSRSPRARGAQSRRVVEQRRTSVTVSTPVTYTPPAPVSYQSASDGRASSYTPSAETGRATAAASDTSYTSAARAGPTGPVSLIGAGTTPSG